MHGAMSRCVYKKTTIPKEGNSDISTIGFSGFDINVEPDIEMDIKVDDNDRHNDIGSKSQCNLESIKDIVGVNTSGTRLRKSGFLSPLHCSP